MKRLLLILILGISFTTYAQNNAPVALNDTIYYSYGEVHLNDTFRIRGNFLINDYDPDGNSLKITDIIYSGPNQMVPFIPNGVVVWIDFMASADFSGNDSFQYIVEDNGSPAKKDTGRVQIIVMRKGYALLNANNITATVRKDVLFQGLANSGPGFETPKNSGIHAVFASNIWLSGTNNGNVYTSIRKFGGQTYKGDHTSNNGPVSNISHTDSLFNTKWDRVWEIWQQQIDYHLLHWQDVGYVADQALLDWPAHGSIVDGEAKNLAPFYDNDQDGTYDPYQGDYPEIKGDQAIYFIYNDGNSPISTNPMVTEVHGMAYAYSCSDSALQNTIFVDYKIYNRSQNTYDSTFIGMWSDMDVGNAQDDYVQCDVMRNLFFMFNGDDYDDANSGRPGYEDYPGAQGVVLLKGAKKDADNTDNAFGVLPSESVNGDGFGDGVADNEYWGLSRFIYFNNGVSATGDPNTQLEHYALLKGYWKDGTSLVYGNSGHVNGGGVSIPAKYMFPDSSDTYYYGTGGDTVAPWNEMTSGNVPADRRGVGSTGPITFKSGDSIELSYAFVFGRDYQNLGAQAGVSVMLEHVDSIQSYYDQGMLNACGFPLSVNSVETSQSGLLIYPNPTQSSVTIRQEMEGRISIEILDVTGKLLFTTVSQSQLTPIDLSGYKHGVYMVKMRNENGVSVVKVIKE
tara:strand:+ start:5226 stop:7268 length:2043 start_codon:yes stop_codon:yes gene_type:complete